MTNESLARKLRVLRAARGITLREAEELTGVTRETIGALEHGQRGAYTNTLKKIAEGYGTTVSELLEEEEPVLAGPKAGAPDPGPRTIEVAGPADEPEHGLKPRLEYDINAAFDRIVAALRDAGGEEALIAEYDGSLRRRALEEVARA